MNTMHTPGDVRGEKTASMQYYVDIQPYSLTMHRPGAAPVINGNEPHLSDLLKNSIHNFGDWTWRFVFAGERHFVARVYFEREIDAMMAKLILANYLK